MNRAAIWPALLCVLLYASGLGGGFIYDDQVLLVDGSRVVTATPKLAFTSDFWGPGHYWRAMHYRPLAMLSFGAVHRMFGMSPFGYHAANILWHAAASATFYLLLLGLGYRAGVAMTASLLFAAHPLHVESVAWMSGMTETQAGALILGSLACFAYGHRAWSLFLAAAAMLTKEAALILPAMVFVLALMHASDLWRWPKWRTAIAAALPYAILDALYLVARSMFVPKPPPGAVMRAIHEGWQGIPGSAAYYLKAIFWPWPMALNYELPSPPFRLLMLIVVALWIIAWLNLPSLRFDLQLSAALIALPLVIPVLTSAIMVHWLQAQDRYAYVACAGACLIVASLLGRLPARGLFMGALFLVPLACLGVVLQVPVWESDEAMWSHTLEVTPSSKIAALNLAFILYQDGRFTEAEVIYLHALRYHPNDPEVTRNITGMRTQHPVPPPTPNQ